jgi:hypothetical protein
MKQVQVWTSAVPQIFAAMRRQGWRCVMTDSTGEPVWAAPDRTRELTVETSLPWRIRVRLTTVRSGDLIRPIGD